MRKLDRKLLPVSHAALHPKVSVLAKFSVVTRRTVSKDHRLSFLFPNLRFSLCLNAAWPANLIDLENIKSWKLLCVSKLMFSCKVILPRALSSLGKFSTDWLNFELTRQKLHAGLCYAKHRCKRMFEFQNRRKVPARLLKKKFSYRSPGYFFHGFKQFFLLVWFINRTQSFCRKKPRVINKISAMCSSAGTRCLLNIW